MTLALIHIDLCKADQQALYDLYSLTQVGIKCVRLEGSMALDVRERMINTFTNDAEVREVARKEEDGGGEDEGF